MTLPIEIFGKDGITSEVTVVATAAVATRSRKLWVKLHNVRYALKASVQVNDAPWVRLSNEAVNVEGPARSWGGIGGGFAVLSLSFDLPPGAVQTGSNTIRFRFERSDGLSMGFRVLGFNFLDADGTRLLPATLFKENDPLAWKAPAGANAATGATLWQSADLTEGAQSTKTLRAHCGDCHAEDGRDLKYFAYSNHAIIERAKFHGLTQAQGEDIAAYIRDVDVGVYGRPWNPPFQPGAGNSSRPLAAFSAGAGLDSIVDEDATLAAIFKAGWNRDSLAQGNELKRFSLIDVPVGLQLPDWNHWLPEIHPKDAISDDFDTTLASQRFKALRDRLREKSKSQTELDAYLANSNPSPFLFPTAGARSDFIGWRDALWELRRRILKVPPEIAFEGPWSDLLARQVYSAAVWGQVKTWELMNKYGLEGYAPKAYPTGEPRAWFSERHLFDTSPFLQGIRGGPTCPLEPCADSSDARWTGSTIGNTRVNYEYLSNSWYHLQLSLNGGQRSCGGHRCTDYGYAYGFLHSVMAATGGLYEGGRRLAWGIKAMEERDTGLGPKFYDGFSLATSNPLRPIGLGQPEVRAWWADSAHPQRRKALEATVQVWAEKIGSWSVERWRAENYDKTEDGANFLNADRVVGEGSVETRSRSLADNLFSGLPELRAVNVHPCVVNALARFGAAMWPKNDWLGQGVAPNGNAPSMPTVQTASGVVKASWTAVPGALSYNLHRASSADGPWLSVALMRPTTSLTDVPDEAGKTYYYAVSANGANSESELSPAAAVAH
ncbi:MAG: hypothetical protein SF187_01285 [Deltaproteobacteria bacterium]|nr:hypothetical protein [Deltaproteobacteria bacterium]